MEFTKYIEKYLHFYVSCFPYLEEPITFLPGEDLGEGRALLASRDARGKNPVAHFI